MSHLYTNLLSAVVVAIAGATLFELWRQRHALLKDELNDELKSMAWRLVIFLIFPLIVWIDLRSTLVASEYLGAWVKDWNYGLLWFSAVPQGLAHENLLMPALFAGVLVQFVLALCLLPALFFRPHPFLAATISYTMLLILAGNLFVDPLIGLVGAGSSRWQIAYASAPREHLLFVLAVYAALSILFVFAMKSKSLRLWFAELTSPVLAEQLRIAISEAQCDRNNQYQSCRLAVLFERAGMRSRALTELRHLRNIAQGTLYECFLEAYIQYRRRHYRRSREAFEKAACFDNLSDQLRASFFAAAACSAYAQGDTHGALNLSERALEFDDNSLVARMVKVDAYLRLGKKEQAGEEVLAALRQGLDFEMENKVPLDCEITLRQIFRYQKDLAARKSRVEESPVLSSVSG